MTACDVCDAEQPQSAMYLLQPSPKSALAFIVCAECSTLGAGSAVRLFDPHVDHLFQYYI